VDAPGTKPVIVDEDPKETPRKKRNICLSMNRSPVEVFSAYLC
jgi:hypothetical protein